VRQVMEEYVELHDGACRVLRHTKKSRMCCATLTSRAHHFRPAVQVSTARTFTHRSLNPGNACLPSFGVGTTAALFACACGALTIMCLR
jgi:hypothetical protein